MPAVKMEELMTSKEIMAYHKGFVDGLACFADMIDGILTIGNKDQVVVLTDAQAVAKTQWNYSPGYWREGD